MKKLFEEIRAALARGENTVLCTVLASSGSAPRGAGARMAVFADGHASGTIGGGAVERIAAEQALELVRTGITGRGGGSWLWTAFPWRLCGRCCSPAPSTVRARNRGTSSR